MKKTEEKKDPRFLKRDELERELVGRDKQALISDCLKIFDTNTMLFEQIQESKIIEKQLKAAIDLLTAEVKRLNARTLWEILNERIQGRIENIRSRRTQVIPTP